MKRKRVQSYVSQWQQSDTWRTLTPPKTKQELLWWIDGTVVVAPLMNQLLATDSIAYSTIINCTATACDEEVEGDEVEKWSRKGPDQLASMVPPDSLNEKVTNLTRADQSLGNVLSWLVKVVHFRFGKVMEEETGINSLSTSNARPLFFNTILTSNQRRLRCASFKGFIVSSLLLKKRLWNRIFVLPPFLSPQPFISTRRKLKDKYELNFKNSYHFKKATDTNENL